MGCIQSNQDASMTTETLCSVRLPSMGLHQFRMLSYLGVGGSAVVRAARKLSGHDSHTIYALKSMKKASLLQRTNGQTTAISELRILSLIDSSFICKCHYAFQDDNFLYFALDFVSGGDMKYNLAIAPGGCFDERRSMFYIGQVFLALQHCHQRGVLHRDIKPENIMLDGTGYIKLTDFGVSKHLSDIEDCRSTSGTHGYLDFIRDALQHFINITLHYHF